MFDIAKIKYHVHLYFGGIFLQGLLIFAPRTAIIVILSAFETPKMQ